MTTTIAIAIPERPKEVWLWCDVEKRHKDGRIDFDVINGAWKGTFFPNNTVRVHFTGKVWPALLVWEGHMSGFDYNEAITKINRILNNGKPSS